MNLNYSNRELLAFTHIKKAAGTTLSHILRINFFLKHCDVKVLSAASGNIFQAADMHKLLKLNPLIRSIAGHSVLPYGDLDQYYRKAKFITILRNPIKRYISQYQHNVEKLGYKGSFETYLDDQSSWNKQVKTIAGSEDLNLAKDILIKKFLLVGIVEEFDTFLILLKMKLEPKNFYPGYKVQNIAKKDSAIGLKVEDYLKTHEEKIEDRNALDIALYQFVKSELLAKEKSLYGSGFETALQDFKRSKKGYDRKVFWYLDYIVRKIYYQPRIHHIRKNNGLIKYRERGPA